jgi:hypothetical protein
MDEALAYLLDLRLRLRDRPEGRALVDRCLLLLARAADADAEGLARIEAEVEALRAELKARFGPAPALRFH